MEFRDLKKQYKKYKSEFDNVILNVVKESRFIGGKAVVNLEKELAEYIGLKYCVTCANGTDALKLVLQAWNIRNGDAVFVPDFTFFSTAEAISMVGATPIFVDVDINTYNIDYKLLEQRIIKIIKDNKLKPKAIIPVDLFGLPANYKKITEIAKKYNLKILEDGAQGFGGSINGKMACSFGDAAITSFFPAKPLGCYGDGGAIFTNDEQLAKLLNSLKVHGKGENKYDNVRIGTNSRLDTIQAAILSVKLKIFKEFELKRINEIAELYELELKNIKDFVKFTEIPKGYISSYAQFTIQLPNEQDRDSLKEYLKTKNIPTFIYYIKPIHKQLVYKNLMYDDNDYKVTNKLCKTVLSLPMHPYLEDKEVIYIVNSIKDYFLN